MTDLINEIDSEINLGEFNQYIKDMSKLENKIKFILNKHQYSELYYKIIMSVHIDLSWSIDLFNNLIVYKVADEIYLKKLINLIQPE